MNENEIYEMLRGVDLTLEELNAKLKRLDELEKQEKTKAQNLAVKIIRNLTKQHKKELERVRKETAREILKAVLEDIGEFYAGDIVEELAKKYGVEVEE